MKVNVHSGSFLIEKKFMRLAGFTLGDYLFVTAWLIFEIGSMLDITVFTYQNRAFPLLIRTMRYLSYLICLICIYYKKTGVERIVGAAICLCGFIFSYIGSHDQTMILYYLLFLAAIDVTADRIVRIAVYVQGCTLLFLVLLSQSGIVLDYVVSEHGRVRHFMGFMYTTFSPILFFHFSLGVVFLMRRRIRLWCVFLLELVNIYFYLMTDTTMTFYTLSLVLFIIFVYRVLGERGQILSIFKFFFVAYPFIAMIVSMVLVSNYDPKVESWRHFNEIVHSRLGLGNTALKKYGVHIFGNSVEWIGFALGRSEEELQKYNYVDSSYLQIMISYGVIFVITVILIYSIIMWRFMKEQEYVVLLIYSAVLTLALSEPRLMNLTFNCFPLLLFADISYQNNNASCRGHFRQRVIGPDAKRMNMKK